MNINDLNKDTIITMTEEMHRVFNASGCDPTCHCCHEKIDIDEKYKLAHINANLIKSAPSFFKTTEEHEVMLCNRFTCTPSKMIEEYLSLGSRKVNMHDRYNERRTFKTKRSGCFIINGKIVP